MVLTIDNDNNNNNDNYDNNNNDDDDDDNEILIKREPLVYTRGALYKKKTKIERLGQYNSNNKLINGQYTSRYNLHLSLSFSFSLSPSFFHTHTHTQTHTHARTHKCKYNDIIHRKSWRKYRFS